MINILQILIKLQLNSNKKKKRKKHTKKNHVKKKKVLNFVKIDNFFPNSKTLLIWFFFTPVLSRGLSLESERKQISSIRAIFVSASHHTRLDTRSFYRGGLGRSDTSLGSNPAGLRAMWARWFYCWTWTHSIYNVSPAIRVYHHHQTPRQRVGKNAWGPRRASFIYFLWILLNKNQHVLDWGAPLYKFGGWGMRPYYQVCP